MKETMKMPGIQRTIWPPRLPDENMSTWDDFTKRMQGTTISPEDWSAFYKRYKEYIKYVCYVKHHISQREHIQEVLDTIVQKYFTDEAIHEFEHRHSLKTSLRSWLNAKIEGAVTQFRTYP